MISVEQYNVSKQSIQNKTIKIQLLNRNFTPYEGVELSGNCIEGNINLDAEADIRRSCSIAFVIDNKLFDIGEFNYIWLNRYIKLSVGIDSLSTGETVWFEQGIFLIDAPSVDYSADSHTLRFVGLDLMSTLNGTRNGYLEGIPTVIPQGSNVRQAMIATLKLGGITNVNIAECRRRDGTIQEVPNDITLEQGSTIYDVLVALRDIMPYYEIFFDIDGTFVYQEIPTGEHEPMIADDDLFNQVLISEQMETNFQAVKNVVEVYGRTIESDYFATDVVVTEDVVSAGTVWTHIDLVVPEYSFASSSEYTYIGFTLNQDITQPTIIIINNDDLARHIVLWADELYVKGHGGNVESLEKDKSYMINYDPTHKGCWRIIEYGQIYGSATDTNPDSPFSIDRVGEIRKVLSGDVYDNITLTDLAYQRAEWELYKSTRLQNTINMTIVPVYYFDVNQLINHAVQDTILQLPYIIKNYSIDLKADGTMNINAIRYYSEYPNI